MKSSWRSIVGILYRWQMISQRDLTNEWNQLLVIEIFGQIEINHIVQHWQINYYYYVFFYSVSWRINSHRIRRIFISNSAHRATYPQNLRKLMVFFVWHFLSPVASFFFRANNFTAQNLLIYLWYIISTCVGCIRYFELICILGHEYWCLFFNFFILIACCSCHHDSGHHWWWAGTSGLIHRTIPYRHHTLSHISFGSYQNYIQLN